MSNRTRNNRLDQLEGKAATLEAPISMEERQRLLHHLISKVRAKGVDPLKLPDPGPDLDPYAATDEQRLGAVLWLLRRVRDRLIREGKLPDGCTAEGVCGLRLDRPRGVETSKGPA